MIFKMNRISTTLSEADLAATFDAIVIGSGYGGAIAAARLTLAGQRVLLLERGREVLPGEYPTDLPTVRREVQISTAKNGPLVPGADGIMDIRINKDMHVIVGCGLGGGSLINANVALECKPNVFNDKRWPAIYAKGEILREHYKTVAMCLGTKTLPDEVSLSKLTALEKSAELSGIGKFERAPINVTFEVGPNHFGNMQVGCTMCGDCCSGCNYGAKNTTLMNYLPYAHANGATIVTQAKVEKITGDDETGFKIAVTDLSNKDDTPPKMVLSTPVVVVAAGTLGSFEILKKSAAAGLRMSESDLGKGFSGNGDILGFGFDANVDHYQPPAAPADPKGPEVPLEPLQPAFPIAPIYSIGAGVNVPNAPQYMPGPCITGVVKVDMGDDDDVKDGLVIEDGSPPGALAMVYPAMFFLNDAISADFTRFPDATRRLRDIADLGTKIQNAGDISELSYKGALAQTQSYLVMSHDGADGELLYEDGNVVVSWPDVGRAFPFPRDNVMLEKYADVIWSNYLPNPTWTKAMGWNLVTVHPVGGCRMADHASDGVVNPYCQVFTGTGDAVYDGLYVCDGSVMPTSLGLNPLMTISAVAELAMAELIQRKNWKINDAPAPANSVPMMQEITPINEPDQVAQLKSTLSDLKTKVDQGIFALKWASWKLAQGTVISNFQTYIIDNLVTDPTEKARLYAATQTAFKELKNADDLIPALNIISTILVKLSKAMTPDAKTDGPSIVTRVLEVVNTDFGDVSPGLKFEETMSGFGAKPGKRFRSGLSDAHDRDYARGKAQNQPIKCDFAVTAPSALDLAALDSKTVPMTGHITIKDPSNGNALTKLHVEHGTFQLLVPDPDSVGEWRMKYFCYLTGGGRPMLLSGHKTLRRTQGSTWWADLTTLPIDLFYRDIPKEGPKTRHFYSGIVRLGLQDLAKQASTITLPYDDPGTSGASATIEIMLKAIEAKSLDMLLTGPAFWNRLVKDLLGVKSAPDSISELAKPINLVKAYFEASVAAKFAGLVFQTYGGVPSYLNNFEARAKTDGAIPPDNAAPLPRHLGVSSKLFSCETNPPTDSAIKPIGQMIRYQGGPKGPVILAPGISTIAQSFAVQTTDQSFVDALVTDGYDVWLLDYRGSPQGGKYNDYAAYDIDDIVANDWPWAVELVLAQTKAKNLQVVGHCVGAMTAQMALLSGAINKTQVRSMISSQLTVHPVTNWFNLLKADVSMARAIYDGLPEGIPEAIGKITGSRDIEKALSGMHVINMVAPTPSDDNTFDTIFDMLMYNVPFPDGEPCNSPTCHRIFGIYGPSYRHKNLNLATHDAIKDLFGKVSVKSFEQLGAIFASGHALNAKGKNVYLPNIANLDFPNHFIAGAQNTLVLPGSSLRTLDWLYKSLPKSREKFTRKVYKGYGHMDTFIGDKAAQDIFPDLIAELNKYS